jgi:hypothetical protein
MFFKRDRACVSRALLRMGFFVLYPFFPKSWAPNTEILVFFFHIFFFVLLGLIIKKSSSVYHQKQKSHISQVFFSTTKNDQWSSQLVSIFRRRDEPEIKKKKFQDLKIILLINSANHSKLNPRISSKTITNF